MLRQTLLRRGAPSRLLILQLQTPGVFPSIRRITTAADSSASSPSTSIPRPPPAASSSSATSTSQPTTPRPPYLVTRTPSLNLPIYTDTKRGGNKKLTILKKIDGDARALKEALRSELRLEEGKIRINHVTGHIEIAVSKNRGLILDK
jgi:large subunit ribosomal protein L49